MQPADSNNRLWAAALGAAATWLLVGLWLLPDYGPTWDAVIGDYQFGERVLEYVATGEATAFDHRTEIDAAAREPHPEFRSNFAWRQLYPLTATLSALSCRVLWTGLGWLPAMTAHNLVLVAMVATLLAALVLFVGRRFGVATGLAAGAFTVIAPRFFGHAFNNVKDTPEAVLYTLATLAGYLALTGGKPRWWCAAGALIGLALAQKANALFIPVQLGALYLIWLAFGPRERRVFPWRGVLTATAVFAVVYFAVSPQLWPDPVGRLGAHLGEIFAAGNALVASAETGIAPPHRFVWSGPFHALCTTPPSLLIFGLIGLCAPGLGSLRWLLLLGVAVPIGRTLLPGMRDFDGVRHFLEFYPPLGVLAALGLRWALRLTGAAVRRARVSVGARVAVVVIAFVPAARETFDTHPNGICYFNSVVGGLAGAQAIGVPDATDYWGNSYWQGLEWLEHHAAADATLVVPVAPDIVRAAAPVRLRADVTLATATETEFGAPLYVMAVTRRGWYGPTLRLLDDAAPSHEIVVQGGVILRIHELASADAARPVAATWLREQRAKRAQDRLLAWVLQDSAERLPAVWPILEALPIVGREEAQRRLDAVLPEPMRRDGREVLWLRDAGG